MTIGANPAELEFGDEPESKVVAEEPQVNPEVTALKDQNASLAREIEGLKTRTAIVDRLQDALGVRTSDPRDEYVRKEIQRLVPELDDITKIKQLLPEILVTLQAAADEQSTVKASTAQEEMKSLMQGIGLDAKDPETVAYLEEALTREIKGNRDLMAAWARGNVKSAVSKAFDKVHSKLFAPIRQSTKRDAVRTITDAPRVAPRGGAPTPAPSAKPALDFKDTSRDNVRKLHDAAFDRLQELMDR